MYISFLWSRMAPMSGAWQWHHRDVWMHSTSDAYKTFSASRVSNFEVRSRTGQPPISTFIKQRWLKLIGHVARADQAEDHNRALWASLNPPSNWRRPRGGPRQTWLQTISDDLKHLNHGLHSAYCQAQDHPLWWKMRKQQCSHSGRATWWWWDGRCAILVLLQITTLQGVKARTYGGYRRAKYGFKVRVTWNCRGR